MGPLQLLVVQPTPFCNIDCRYCYLADRANRARMDDKVFSRLLDLVLASPLSHGGFDLVWHGGEPLAAGVALLERQACMVDARNRDHVPISLGVQTNGTLIDAMWARFFRGHRVRVGISIDGPAALHDASRRTRAGRGTFDAVERGIGFLRDAGVAFDVLCVVTRDTLRHADELLGCFAELGAERVGFNVEELEGAHASTSLDFSSVDAAFDEFWRCVIAAGSRLDRMLPVRELDDGLLRLALGAPVHDDQRAPLRILTCDHRGGLSTFSPELAGSPAPAYGDFVFTHVDDLDRLEWMAELPQVRAVARRIQDGVDRCRAGCPYFSACGGGVPANKFFECGTFDATETLFCRAAIQAPLRAALGWAERTVAGLAGGTAT